MDLGIKDRVAIVTGGSRGIGRESAREFLQAGAKVMICSRTKDELEKTRDELAKQTGGEIKCIVADTTKPADIARVVDETVKTFGTVDILVNCAGTMYSGRFEEMTDEGLQKQLDTKLFGFMRMIRTVAPIMRVSAAFSVSPGSRCGWNGRSREARRTVHNRLSGTRSWPAMGPAWSGAASSRPSRTTTGRRAPPASSPSSSAIRPAGV